MSNYFTVNGKSLLIAVPVTVFFVLVRFAVAAVAAAEERNAEDVESAFVTFFVAAVAAAMRTVPVPQVSTYRYARPKEN